MCGEYCRYTNWLLPPVYRTQRSQLNRPLLRSLRPVLQTLRLSKFGHLSRPCRTILGLTPSTSRALRLVRVLPPSPRNSLCTCQLTMATSTPTRITFFGSENFQGTPKTAFSSSETIFVKSTVGVVTSRDNSSYINSIHNVWLCYTIADLQSCG